MSLQHRPEPTALVKVVEDASVLVSPEQQRAYGELYQQRFQRLVAFARRYTNRETASDAVHDVLMETWIRWTEGKIAMPTALYLYRAVRNKIADEREREYRESVHLGDFLREWLERVRRRSAPDEAYEQRELARLLEETVRAMPKRCRAVWVLVRENGLTYDQAAESMGITLSTAKGNMTRAQSILREAITDGGYRKAALLAQRERTKLLPTPAAEDSAHE